MINNFMNEQEAREMICEIGKRAYNKNFVNGSDGNISIRIGNDLILATPTGVSKGFMSPEMMVKMTLDNILVGENLYKPSSEVKMHLRVYMENSDIRAVIHAHPPLGTAFAVAGLSLNDAMMAEGVVFLGAVPCSEYALPGSQSVPDSIAGFCSDYNACFLANHGTLTWGESILDAYYRLESLEQACKVYIVVNNFLGKPNLLSIEAIEDLYRLRESAGIKRGGKLKSATD
jgi:L-fuculose-phosphate aldolase